jgi:hypothetical protein
MIAEEEAGKQRFCGERSVLGGERLTGAVNDSEKPGQNELLAGCVAKQDVGQDEMTLKQRPAAMKTV